MNALRTKGAHGNTSHDHVATSVRASSKCLQCALCLRSRLRASHCFLYCFCPLHAYMIGTLYWSYLAFFDILFVAFVTYDSLNCLFHSQMMLWTAHVSYGCIVDFVFPLVDFERLCASKRGKICYTTRSFFVNFLLCLQRCFCHERSAKSSLVASFGAAYC